MAVADKIVALLDTMTLASLESLSPVRRRQFADLCRHWADIAERSGEGSAIEARARASERDTADVLAAGPPVGDAER
jgi:hypothetical protein